MNFTPLIPEFVAAGGLAVLIVLDLALPDRVRWALGWGAIAVCAAALAAVALVGNGAFGPGLFVVDGLARVWKGLVLVSTIIVVLTALDVVRRLQRHRGEFYALLLSSVVGAMVLGSANDLVTLYVGLELVTLVLFVLSAFRTDEKTGAESGLKYLLIGAFSSGILLFGLSWVYGLSGSTAFKNIAVSVASADGMALSFAIVLVVAGLAFKLAAAPFHMWAPDVYTGAPTPVTAFLSVVSKGAGIVAVVRLFFAAMPGAAATWVAMFGVLAIITMIVGNFVALAQTDFKRLLAYSAIAQVGYALVGLSGGGAGVSAVMVFLMAYLFANIGAFLIVVIVEQNHGSPDLSHCDGLARTSPLLGVVAIIFMLSLVGIPPMGGFIAKYLLFGAALNAGYIGLVIVGVAMSVVSLFYYVGVIKRMYFHSIRHEKPATLTFVQGFTLGLCATGTLVVGILPDVFVRLGNAAGATF